MLDAVQVADYNMQPEVSLVAEDVKACLQETDEVPRDITSLFDNSLFKLDTSLVPKVIKYVTFRSCCYILLHYSHYCSNTAELPDYARRPH